MSSKCIHQMTIPQWEKAFPTEERCQAYLAANRWPSGVRCPRCGSDHVFALKTMAFKWECMDCGAGVSYRFSVPVGTIFENTNKPLRDWFRVIHMMLTSKKGISALQVMRVMGFGSYKTAHYMCHRVRAGLAHEEFRKLMGIVEVDETYIGGDDNNRHFGKKQGHKHMGGKFAVVGAVERKGKVVARVLDKVNTLTLETFVNEACSTDVSLIATDEHRGYQDLKRIGFNHGTVNHSRKKYVVGAIHTNTI